MYKRQGRTGTDRAGRDIRNPRTARTAKRQPGLAAVVILNRECPHLADRGAERGHGLIGGKQLRSLDRIAAVRGKRARRDAGDALGLSLIHI